MDPNVLWITFEPKTDPKQVDKTIETTFAAAATKLTINFLRRKRETWNVLTDNCPTKEIKCKRGQACCLVLRARMSGAEWARMEVNSKGGRWSTDRNRTDRNRTDRIGLLEIGLILIGLL